jgi:predicted nucleotidyltransferase
MAVNQEIRQIAEIIWQTVPAEQIYLFGSHAYGQPNKDSDYDFFLIIPDGAMRPMEAMQQAQLALARNMRRRTTPIDILATSRSSFNHMRTLLNTVEKDVDQKGVLLFERSNTSDPMA